MSPIITVCILIVYIIVVSVLTDGSLAARLPDIYWNSTNPIFRIDNTDHIIDVNRGNVAYEYDQVNIVCPVYPSSTRAEDIETYIIYNVSKEEYDTCHIVNRTIARTIAVCDKPFSSRYFTVTFRPFTPQPGGLEFRPGQDYYFISLNPWSHSAEMCNRHHMKVVFKVCCKRGQVPPAQRSTTTSTTTTPQPVIHNATVPNIRSQPKHHYLGPIVNISSNRVPASPDQKLPWYHHMGPNMITTPRPATTRASVFQSTTAMTPYWWRPHFTKLPIIKNDRGASDQAYQNKKKEVRDKRPNDTREKSDGLNSSADMSSPIRTITLIFTINLLFSCLR